MNLTMRPGKPEDAKACGAICYEAFKAIADEHHFPPDFPDIETAVGLMNYIFSGAGVYSVVAEEETDKSLAAIFFGRMDLLEEWVL
jgi:hypothetical protein